MKSRLITEGKDSLNMRNKINIATKHKNDLPDSFGPDYLLYPAGIEVFPSPKRSSHLQCKALRIGCSHGV